MVHPRRLRLLGALVVLALLAACDGAPALEPEEARAEIDQVLPALLEAAVGDRQSAPADPVAIPCDAVGTAVTGAAERHARIAPLRPDDDPAALVAAARAHMEDADIAVVRHDEDGDAPHVEGERDGVRHALVVDLDARRVTATGTTPCYPPDGR